MKLSRDIRAAVAVAALALAGWAGADERSLLDCDLAAFESLRDDTIDPLFRALQSGDIDGIRRHLGDDMAAEYERLFTQNPEYGDFLREYYQNSGFELIDVVQRGDGYTAIVRIFWADGRSVEANLGLGDPSRELSATIQSSCN